MRKLPLFLAWRYLKGTYKEKSISTMVIISFLGICIGSFALALIASVMNGFEKITHEKMQSIHPQIIMHAHGQELNYAKIATIMKKEFPEVAYFSPNAIKQVIAKSDTQDDYNIAVLKAVDPIKETQVCNIESKIIKSITNKKTIESATRNNTILIGAKLAENLDITIGDTIPLFFSKNDKITRKRIRLDQKDAVVGGLFKTGIEEFDNGLIISSLKFFNTIFEDAFESTGITHLSVTLKPQYSNNARETQTIKKLKERFSVEVHSWKELYPALVEALKLEKYAMFLILALITLVASMNIISLLFMQITQKRGDIAILKAMGLAHKKVSQIFLFLGMSISIIGSIIGLILAFIAGWILETYPFIKLPEAYYVTHLPAKMEWQIFATVFIVVMLLSFISTWLPARRTRKINISEVLRFEG